GVLARVGVFLLSLVAAGTLGGWLGGRVHTAYAAAMVVIVYAVTRALRPRLKDVLDNVTGPSSDLRMVTALVECAGAARFADAKLQALQQSVHGAAAAIAALARRIEWMEAQRNPLLGPFL